MSTRAGKDIITANPNDNGSLGCAISEAIELAVTTPGCRYTLGSVLNHVCLHQTIIGLEAEKQMELAGEYPDIVIACSGVLPCLCCNNQRSSQVQENRGAEDNPLQPVRSCLCRHGGL